MVGNVSGTSSTLLSAGDKITGVAISPDRKWIAYTTPPAVFVVGVDGSSPHQVSEPITPPAGYDVTLDGPEWSPDGNTIYLGYGLYDSESGGTALSTVAVGGGAVTMLQAAMGSNCTGVSDPRFSPDGSYLIALHSVCIDGNNEGLWKHTPDGSGALLVHAELELTKPLIFPDGTILALGQVGSADGILVVGNGAVTGTIPAPAGYSMDSITESPDGSTLVVQGHDTTMFANDLYVTTDLQNFTPITTDGKNKFPSF